MAMPNPTPPLKSGPGVPPRRGASNPSVNGGRQVPPANSGEKTIRPNGKTIR